MSVRSSLPDLPENAATSPQLGGPVGRMYSAAATAFTRRKQVAIATSAWPDWLIVSKLEYVPGDYGLMKAVQATGQHMGAELLFEAASLRAVRIF